MVRVVTVYKLRVRHMAQPAPQVVCTSCREDVDVCGTPQVVCTSCREERLMLVAHHRSCALAAEKKG